MTALRTVSPAPSGAENWQAEFMELLPQIQQQLRREFRRLRAEAAEEAMQEATASCLQAFVRLCQQDRRSAAHPSTLARFAAQQLRCGRQVAGSLNVKDPLSRYAQYRQNLRVHSLDQRSVQTGARIEEAVVGVRTPVLERVALRIDLPQWLKRLTRRMQRIARDLALGYTTSEVALKYGVSAGRIAQIRRELAGSWEQFQGNVAAGD